MLLYHTCSRVVKLAIRSMPSLSAKAQQLSDVELAVLLSLASDEHCIIHSETECLVDLRDEVRLVCRASIRILHGSLLSHFKVASITFGLSHVTIACGTSTTVDDINAGILTKVLQHPKLATGNVCDEPAQEDVSGLISNLSTCLIYIHRSLFHHRAWSLPCSLTGIRFGGPAVQLLLCNMHWSNPLSLCNIAHWFVHGVMIYTMDQESNCTDPVFALRVPLLQTPGLLMTDSSGAGHCPNDNLDRPFAR